MLGIQKCISIWVFTKVKKLPSLVEGGEGGSLAQRFYYITRLRRKKPENYKAEIQKVLTKMKMPSVSIPNVFGLGNGSKAPTSALPDPKRRKKTELDT